MKNLQFLTFTLLLVFTLNTSASELPHTIPQGYEWIVSSVVFSSDGLTLASGGLDNQVFFWTISPQAPESEPDAPVVDINADGIFNILDLVRVAAAIGE